MRTAHQLDVRELPDGAVEFTTRGEDPFIELNRFQIDEVPISHTVLAMEYFCPSGLDGLAVYHGPPIHEGSRLDAGSLVRAESWLPHAIDLQSLSGGRWTRARNQLRLDFGGRPGVTIRIRNLHLRAPGPEEKRSQAEREAERRDKLLRESRVNAFYQAAFPDRIGRVAIDGENVLVNGRLSARAGNRRLIELRPEISIADHAAMEGRDFVLENQAGIRDAGELSGNGAFGRRLPRAVATFDRTTSRWAVAEPLPGRRWRLRSHWKYAGLTAAAGNTGLPRMVPKGLKGMGGVSAAYPLEELRELGVHNITVNLPITGLMAREARKGSIPFQHGGRVWHVNAPAIRNHDKLMEFAFANDIVVSAILLVNFADSSFGRAIIHPEADRAGHYAMPNFTSPEGVAAYEAVLEFLAQRYTRPDGAHGRIANWIVHNEVGQGWEWTNMGRQPPMLYMDSYLRSLRLVHNVALRHDPHARVFISLTHHWNTRADPTWRSASNRALLERLVESCRVEGDFAWGVAYHPYPQNLRRPDAWNDTRVTDDFDTPLITPKNIAVLDRWMQRPEMRNAAGRIRGVLLSEQGFNTPDYSIENQRLQAAGFVYMWRQMRGLSSIEAFHNHRWVDHPGEGGLLLGLRKLPDGSGPVGGKKFAWEVYRALDTLDEAGATVFADEVIGAAAKP